MSPSVKDGVDLSCLQSEVVAVFSVPVREDGVDLSMTAVRWMMYRKVSPSARTGGI